MCSELPSGSPNDRSPSTFRHLTRCPINAKDQLKAIVAWYFDHVYGRWEGSGVLPYYCDRSRVGSFAISPGALAAGRPSSLFRLFVMMALYQARRDVLVMALQRRLPGAVVEDLTSPSRLRRLVLACPCRETESASRFDSGCVLRKRQRGVSCDPHPRLTCHVKQASIALRRTADMGKLPTSAWLHLVRERGLARGYRSVLSAELDPFARADKLVNILMHVYRVGRKLATMYVSALSTPALAPGLTPWFPAVDGARLVVVDTNVAQMIDLLAHQPGFTTYDQRARWIAAAADEVDLRRFRGDLPRRSPRLVQQALYSFRSKSNRTATVGRCSSRSKCERCPLRGCPYRPP